MISIIVPVYNEQENIAALITRLDTSSPSWGEDYEVIFVDDGSTDRTLEILREYNKQRSNIRYLSFSRNFGHQTAVSAGLEEARGDVVAVIDADLQDPPEVLLALLEKWRQGFEVVYAVRTKRKEGVIKRCGYWLFYRILAELSSVPIPLDAGDFCVMDRKVVDLVKSLPERNRFVRGLRSWVGFKQVGVQYERPARAAGDAKYDLRKLLRLAIDGIIGFTYRPLRLIGVAGLMLSAVSILGLFFFFVMSVFNIPILGHSPREAPGYTSLMLAVLLLGGVQLSSLWVIGEYVGRIFDEVKRRPLYIIKEKGGGNGT